MTVRYTHTRPKSIRRQIEEALRVGPLLLELGEQWCNKDQVLATLLGRLPKPVGDKKSLRQDKALGWAGLSVYLLKSGEDLRLAEASKGLDVPLGNGGQSNLVT